MNEWIDQLSQRLSTSTSRIATLRELDDEQLSWQPAPGKWSILQCVDHLFVTGATYYPLMKQRLAVASAPPRFDGHRPTFMARMMLKFLAPDSRPVKAPKMFVPGSSRGDRKILDRFLEQQQELASMLEQARGKELNKGKFPSPALRLLRLTLADAFAIMIAHQEKHWAQIERTRSNHQQLAEVAK